MFHNLVARCDQPVVDVDNEENTDKYIAPFWVNKLKGYVFDASGETELCLKKKRVTATSRADTNAGTEAGSPAGFTYASFNRHVYLCDVAFTAVPGGHHGYATLTEALSSANHPTPGAKINIAAPSSLSCTLYHELFHLTDSAGSDNDNGCSKPPSRKSAVSWGPTGCLTAWFGIL